MQAVGRLTGYSNTAIYLQVPYKAKDMIKATGSDQVKTV
jgi:hypothetical protein